jgi:hypothetical protein
MIDIGNDKKGMSEYEKKKFVRLLVDMMFRKYVNIYLKAPA